MRATAGFTLVELLIASAITMAAVGAILAVVTPAQTLLRAQEETADLYQRIRAVSDALASDLRTAVAVRPYRIGAVGDDTDASVYYRPDTISVIAGTTRTYYLRADSSSLMMYDGGLSDLPMVEHVTGLGFDYFGRGLVPLPPAALVDGPWLEDAWHRRIDEDVLRIRAVHITARLEGTVPSLRRYVPGAEIALSIALRTRDRMQ